MPLSWNEVRERAIRFSAEWRGETREEAEAKSFWDAFFNVFGVSRRAQAAFEIRVRNIRGQYGFIDLFWPGVLLAEHKSAGKDLNKAEAQAFQYIQDLARDNRADEIPRYVIVSDFARMVLFDLETDEELRFPLAELERHIRRFAFMKGEQPVRLDPEDPANERAYRIMVELHDALEHGGFTGHELEQFLVRVLFCLFAEDNGIFEPLAFQSCIEHRTAEDGSDLGAQLNRLFDVLNTPENRRQQLLDEDLAAFPYVNGALFAERLGFADFNRDMRNALLACCRFQWARISPAVFGSLFQGIMEDRKRRQQGAHYTSERDIMKVVRSLFLDDLRAEFAQRQKDKSTGRRARLEEFHRKLRSLYFLDPACGCGNFLVLAYRELRRLELEVLKELFGKQTELTLAEINKLSQVDVDQFYGIELGEWPVRIAEVALWLMDHQMNQELTEAFGQRYRRLPLRSTPHIACGNALRLDWRTLLPPDQCSFVLGNPPFVGKHYQNQDQRADLAHVFRDFKNTGDIDYVVAWFHRAAEYIQGTQIKVGFVATNSITQGEQVPIVWGLLFGRSRIKIHFAHRTFAWESEARGKAHVHVVIIGFAAFDTTAKRIYDYETDPPSVTTVANISPYLTPGSDAFVTKRSKPLCDVLEMRCGNKPTDDGNFILSDEEKTALVKAEPGAKKFLRRFVGSEEFLNGNPRWCLWLEAATPAELDALPQVLARVRKVREFRLRSTAAPTRKAAGTPTLFFFRSQPITKFIAIPEVSSERREFIPIGFLRSDVIVSNKIYLVASSSRYLLGVLSSSMHMAWVKQIAGRLESRFQYSGSMVYNTFPWPSAPDDKQRTSVETAAQAVLDSRAQFPDSTLAQLYDPAKMPPVLRKAHDALDRAVDRCYRKEPFTNERQRVEFLFALYEKLTAPLIAAAKPKRAPRKNPPYAKPPPAPVHPSLTPEQAYGDAAHYYSAKEEGPPYRTEEPLSEL